MKDYTVSVTFTSQVLAYNKGDAINMMQYLIDHKEAIGKWEVEIIKKNKPKRQIRKKK